jgi:4-hydroxybenzoate polyprenyltransferase
MGKKLFVFIPLFFSGNVTHPQFLIKSIFAFVAFSLIASSIYILNDYKDIEADRKHPEKKNRPLQMVLFLKDLVCFYLLFWFQR